MDVAVRSFALVVRLWPCGRRFLGRLLPSDVARAFCNSSLLCLSAPLCIFANVNSDPPAAASISSFLSMASCSSHAFLVAA